MILVPVRPDPLAQVDIVRVLHNRFRNADARYYTIGNIVQSLNFEIGLFITEYIIVLGIALLIIQLVLQKIDIATWVSGNQIIVILIACLIGLIPESGPHLVFVSLFATGSIPFSVLLASSIVQDGHGMIPLLAETKRGFLTVKAVNVVFGVLVGIIGLLAGF